MGLYGLKDRITFWMGYLVLSNQEELPLILVLTKSLDFSGDSAILPDIRDDIRKRKGPEIMPLVPQ